MFCFAITLIVALVAAVWALDSFDKVGNAGGGGLRFALKGGIIVVVSAVLAAASSLAGVVFGLAGVVLTRIHPHGKVLLPVVGLTVNGMPLFAAAMLYLYLQF